MKILWKIQNTSRSNGVTYMGNTQYCNAYSFYSVVHSWELPADGAVVLKSIRFSGDLEDPNMVQSVVCMLCCTCLWDQARLLHLNRLVPLT